MSNYELELVKGRERMEIVCNIARKRINSTKNALGIPQAIVTDEYIIQKSPENIALITEAVNDVNKMLNLELINLGVVVATDDLVRKDVDDVRTRLAEIVQILGKGCPSPKTETIREEPCSYPMFIGVTAIASTVLAATLAFIFADSRD